MNGRTEALELGGMLAVIFETYRVTADAVKELDQPIGEKKLAARVLVQAKKQILEDKIARPEGATQPGVETAVAKLVEEGVLARGELGLALASEERRLEIVKQLDGYVRALGDAGA